MAPSSPTRKWSFPPVASASPEGLVGIGADLEPTTLLDAYSRGIFPMPLGDEGLLAWWSPDPRGVLPLERLRVSRSLRRSLGRFQTTLNQAFEDVVAGCADPVRPHGWITPEIVGAYSRLHSYGAAHSVEVWDEDGSLVGGLYGVAIGGLFAAESKFHRASDASKVALVRLVEELMPAGQESGALLDVQWCTPHLASLGAIEVRRDEYLRRLAGALESDTPGCFAR